MSGENESVNKHFTRPTAIPRHFPVAKRSLYLFGIVLIGFLAGGLGFLSIAAYVAPQYVNPPSTIPSLINRPINTVGIQIEPTDIKRIDQYLVAVLTKENRSVETDYSSLPNPGVLKLTGGILTASVFIKKTPV